MVLCLNKKTNWFRNSSFTWKKGGNRRDLMEKLEQQQQQQQLTSMQKIKKDYSSSKYKAVYFSEACK